MKLITENEQTHRSVLNQTAATQNPTFSFKLLKLYMQLQRTNGMNRNDNLNF